MPLIKMGVNGKQGDAVKCSRHCSRSALCANLHPLIKGQFIEIRTKNNQKPQWQVLLNTSVCVRVYVCV